MTPSASKPTLDEHPQRPPPDNPRGAHCVCDLLGKSYIVMLSNLHWHIDQRATLSLLLLNLPRSAMSSSPGKHAASTARSSHHKASHRPRKLKRLPAPSPPSAHPSAQTELNHTGLRPPKEAQMGKNAAPCAPLISKTHVSMRVRLLTSISWLNVLPSGGFVRHDFPSAPECTALPSPGAPEDSHRRILHPSVHQVIEPGLQAHPEHRCRQALPLHLPGAAYGRGGPRLFHTSQQTGRDSHRRLHTVHRCAEHLHHFRGDGTDRCCVSKPPPA